MSAFALQQAVYSALATVFSSRVYPLAAPPSPALPYAVVSTESATTENTICGRSDLTNYRFRINIYAATMAELLALRAQVLDAMDSLGAIPAFETDIYEPEIQAMRRVLDFSTWHKE